MSYALSISSSKLIASPIQSTKTKHLLSKKSIQNLIRDNNYNGFISKSTTKRIREMVENLVFAIDTFRVDNKHIKGASSIQPTFVTLTLSYGQMKNDNEIKRNMLMRFLEIVKKEKGVQYYVWRAEPQINGNIHFHIIMDRFIDWQWIRAIWNKIQAKHLYIDAFEQKNGHRNPNSTDIHGLKQVGNIAAYICKYMVKDKPLRIITGRIWGCSSNLHKMKNPRIEINQEVYEDLKELQKTGRLFKKVYDYCEVFKYKMLAIVQTTNNVIYSTYRMFINQTFNLKIYYDIP